jgi:anaerobic selenocysteine-containing dehydrogenase
MTSISPLQRPSQKKVSSPARSGEGTDAAIPATSLPHYQDRLSFLQERTPAFDRRTLLKTMGASLALAGLSGCNGEANETALPYVRHPEGITVGKARWYATAALFAGYAQPVLGKTYAGCPVKLEGNPDHPVSQGKSDAFTQAALLGLYDPARSQSPLRNGRPVSWSSFDQAAYAQAKTLDANGGKGFRLLTGPLSSPTMLRQIETMMQRWPKARWHVTDPGRPDEWLRTSRALFGEALDQHPAIDEAEVVISLDADFLGPGPRQTLNARLFGRAWQARRTGERTFRLFVAEPSPSATGTVADRRLAASPSDIARLLPALAEAVEQGQNARQQALSDREREWISDAAAALKGAGRRSLALAGEYLSPELQALAMQINAQLGAIGQTMRFTGTVLAEPPDTEIGLPVLADAISAGEVTIFAMLDVNPGYASPSDLNFAELLKTVGTTIHAGLHVNETSMLCDWHLPLQHALESWGDARAVDGTAVIIQPLVRPFYDVRAATVLLENLAGRSAFDRARSARSRGETPYPSAPALPQKEILRTAPKSP